AKRHQTNEKMKAIDTFRKEPWRHNCAQAIANRWVSLYDDKDIVDIYAPYIGGRAPQGYCGALYAAMQACPAYAEAIIKEFTESMGATHCSELKRNHRTPCEICVNKADELVEKYAEIN
ncbi:MAG: hypothetical protein K2K37_05185, partial [Muribaculaceae bacterium]|nr:hypothetical protein [Muribaculaceae bacterium]